MHERLGVPLMDREHAAIERLFADVESLPDEALPDLFDKAARELRGHCAREEAMMAKARAPRLLLHMDLHARLLAEVEQMRKDIETAPPATVRELVGTVLPLMISNHVATEDLATARFLAHQRKSAAADDPPKPSAGAGASRRGRG